MKDSLSFTKMQGSGNDFVVLDNRSETWSLNQLIDLAPQICNRRYGVGADGLIALAPSDEADYTMIYRNADGSDAGMCGNGGRCIARFAVNLGYSKSHTFQVHDEIYQAELQEGDPRVMLHFPSETKISRTDLDIESLEVYPGTEHVVLPVSAAKLRKTNTLRKQGKTLRHHTVFQPKGTNVNFMHGESENTLSVQTYERGVEDLTLACGTGAIASALAWHYLQDQKDGEFNYSVFVQGGTLEVQFTYNKQTDRYSNLKLGGPAHFVFQGSYYI